MNNFPELEGIHWVSSHIPDIILVKTRAVETDVRGIESDFISINIEPSSEVEIDFYMDLTKVSCVREFYIELNETSDTECIVELSGETSYVLDVNVFEMLKAWEFCKKWHYDNKTV